MYGKKCNTGKFYKFIFVPIYNETHMSIIKSRRALKHITDVDLKRKKKNISGLNINLCFSRLKIGQKKKTVILEKLTVKIV